MQESMLYQNRNSCFQHLRYCLKLDETTLSDNWEMYQMKPLGLAFKKCETFFFSKKCGQKILFVVQIWKNWIACKFLCWCTLKVVEAGWNSLSMLNIFIKLLKSYPVNSLTYTWWRIRTALFSKKVFPVVFRMSSRGQLSGLWSWPDQKATDKSFGTTSRIL